MADQPSIVFTKSPTCINYLRYQLKVTTDPSFLTSVGEKCVFITTCPSAPANKLNGLSIKCGMVDLDKIADFAKIILHG